MKQKSQLIPSIAILIETIVGAGFLGIPFVVAKSGFIIGAFHIVIIGLIMLLTNLYLGEMSLRTKGNHQLTGYAEKYLGKKGKHAMLIGLLLLILPALLAYTIGVSQSISFLIDKDFSLQLPIAILFLIFMTITLSFGITTFKNSEVIGLFIMGALLIGIVVMFAPQIEVENLSNFNLSHVFAPFGIVLFAYLSLTALPELERILEYQKHKMKKAILLGSIIPIVGYLLFVMVVVGFKGANVPEVATLSMGIIFILLGIIAMTTSYIALAFAMKAMLHYDYRCSQKVSWLITSLSAIFLYTIAYKMHFTFTGILEIAGVITGSITGILTLLMIRKAKIQGSRNPEYSIPINKWIFLLIILIFIIGGVMTLSEYINFAVAWPF